MYVPENGPYGLTTEKLPQKLASKEREPAEQKSEKLVGKKRIKKKGQDSKEPETKRQRLAKESANTASEPASDQSSLESNASKKDDVGYQPFLKVQRRNSPETQAIVDKVIQDYIIAKEARMKSSNLTKTVIAWENVREDYSY